VVSFTPWPLYPWGKRNWMGGWVSPRTALDDIENLKFLYVEKITLFHVSPGSFHVCFQSYQFFDLQNLVILFYLHIVDSFELSE
jgi:hypothetical protein